MDLKVFQYRFSEGLTKTCENFLPNQRRGRGMYISTSGGPMGKRSEGASHAHAPRMCGNFCETFSKKLRFLGLFYVNFIIDTYFGNYRKIRRFLPKLVKKSMAGHAHFFRENPIFRERSFPQRGIFTIAIDKCKRTLTTWRCFESDLPEISRNS